jgi:hypothetical protein
MIRKSMMLAAVLGLVVVVGCEKGTTPSSKPTTPPSSMMAGAADAAKDMMNAGKDKVKEGAEKVKEAGKDVADKASELAAKAKETFLTPIKGLVEKADEKITKLADEEKGATGDAKKVLSDKIAKGKELVGKLKAKLAEVAASTGADTKWEALKTEIEKLVTDLKSSVGL